MYIVYNIHYSYTSSFRNTIPIYNSKIDSIIRANQQKILLLRFICPYLIGILIKELFYEELYIYVSHGKLLARYFNVFSFVRR